MNHNHDNAPARRPVRRSLDEGGSPNTGGASCPHCVAAKNQTVDGAAYSEKLRSFLGICGCFSCYIAMFPAILLGIVGVFGFSSTRTLDALSVYMGSVLFQPILIISILLLIVGLLRYGKMSLILSVFTGIGIFVSMNFYIRAWLFTLSFGMLALAYYLAFRKTKAQQLKVALVFLLAVVVLGVIDLSRVILLSPSQPPSINDMNMMNTR